MVKSEIISWVRTLLLAVGFALFINYFVIVNASVPTGSMMDTIQENTRIVALRFSYIFSEPKRLDVVVFKFPDNEKELYVKRIIGLPGETVEVTGGIVYIDGEPLTEPYAVFKKEGRIPPDFGPYTVPEGQYFMLGDNRNNSKDSRVWDHTCVERKKILGHVIFSYYTKGEGFFGIRFKGIK